MEKVEGGPVQSLDRAFDVLEILVQSDTPMGVSEVAVQVDLPKSTVHRLLRALVNRQYARQDPRSRRYEAALRLATLGDQVRSHSPIFRQSALHLRRLAQQSDCTASLVVSDPPVHMLVLDTVTYADTPLVERGTHLAWESIAGWVWAACLPDDEQTLLLETKVAGGWPGAPEAIQRRWQDIRNQGYEWRTPNTERAGWALAMPIWGKEKNPRAIMILSNTGGTPIDEERQKELHRLLLRTTTEISAALGHTSPTTF